MDVKIIIRYIFCCLLALSSSAFAGILAQDNMNNGTMIPVVNQSINNLYKNSHCNVGNNILEYSTDHPNSGTGGYKFTLGPYSSSAEWLSDCELQYRGPVNDSGTVRSNFIIGQEYWVGIDVYVPSTNKWPEIDVHPEGGGTEWGLIFQFHGSNNPCDISGINPPVPAYLRADPNGTEWVEGYTGFIWRVLGDTRECLPDRNYEYTASYPMPFSRDTHNRYVMNFKFSYDPTDGPFMRIWQNNNDVNNPDVDDHGINMYKMQDAYRKGPYFEFGVYGHMTTTFVVYADDLTVLTPDPGQSRSSCFNLVYPGDTTTPTNISPTISISIDGSAGPTIQSTSGTSHNFQSSPADSDGSISSVSWHMDGAVADQSVEDPGSLQCDTTGTFDIYAVATDDDGAQTQSNHIQLIIGTPPLPITGLVHRYEFESGAIETDGEGNTNLVNDNSVVVDAGDYDSEDLYGTTAAVFNGTNQSFHITEENYDTNAPWQTGQPDGTLAIAFVTPSSYPTTNQFLFSLWDQTNNERVVGLNLSSGNLAPIALAGVSSGTASEAFASPVGLSLSTVYTAFLYIDSVSGSVHARVHQGATVVSDWTGTISGTMNITNRPDMYLGCRSDLVRYFSGRELWARLYNTELSGAQMQEIATNVTPTAPSTVTVDTGGGTPYLEIEGGSNDPQCAYTSGNNTSTLTFHCEVSAASGHTSGGSPVIYTVNGIQANGGTIGGTGSVVSVRGRTSTIGTCVDNGGCSSGWSCFGGYCTDYSVITGDTFTDGQAFDIDVAFEGSSAVDTTLPTSGAVGALNYETPFYIDTVSSYSINDYYPCDCTTKAELTGDLFYHTGQTRCQCIEFTGGIPYIEGNSNKIAIREQRDSGGPIYLRYYGGTGTNVWVFTQTVGITEVESTNVVMTDTSEFLLDRYSSGTPAEVLSSSGESVATTLPRNSASNTGNVIILGTPHIRFAAE